MRLLLGLAALTAALLIGDGIRRAGRALEIRAESDADIWDQFGDDDDTSGTIH